MKWKIKTFLVATNVVASRPPERRPTATPTARAKIQRKFVKVKSCYEELLVFVTLTLSDLFDTYFLGAKVQNGDKSSKNHRNHRRLLCPLLAPIFHNLHNKVSFLFGTCPPSVCDSNL